MSGMTLYPVALDANTGSLLPKPMNDSCRICLGSFIEEGKLSEPAIVHAGAYPHGVHTDCLKSLYVSQGRQDYKVECILCPKDAQKLEVSPFFSGMEKAKLSAQRCLPTARGAALGIAIGALGMGMGMNPIAGVAFGVIYSWVILNGEDLAEPSAEPEVGEVRSLEILVRI